MPGYSTWTPDNRYDGRMEIFRVFSRLVLVTFCLLLSGPGFLAGQDPATPPTAAPPKMEKADLNLFPEIVAQVNGVEIHKAELISRTEAIREQMGLPPGDLPIQIYRTVLEDMVGVELLFQSSQTSEMEATSEEVDKEFEGLRSRYPSEGDFEKQLAAESISIEELKSALRKDLSVQKLVEKKLAVRVNITDENIRRFYDENQSEMQQPEQFKVRHILIRADQDATPEAKAAARQKIETLRRRIVDEGADFSALAQENSEDPASRRNGGSITMVRGQTVEQFENAAVNLAPGGVSDVVETQYGFHILKLDEKVPARTVPFEEVSARIKDYLMQQEVRQVVKMEVETLKQKATVATFI